MTCIVAIEKDGIVYMGGDSAGANGWDIRSVLRKKVFIRGEFLIGYTTSFRMGQLLEFFLDVPQRDGETDIQYMVTRFIPACQKLFKENGYSEINNNVERGGQFLVGYRGHVYAIYDDYQVGSFHDPFSAVGSGYAYALGALENIDINEPEAAIMKALETAGKFSNGVCPPYYVMSTGKVDE